MNVSTELEFTLQNKTKQTKCTSKVNESIL